MPIDIGAMINADDPFHRRNKGSVLLGRDYPVAAAVRFKFIFLSVRATVLKWALSTMFSSTTYCLFANACLQTDQRGAKRIKSLTDTQLFNSIDTVD